jgi:hypothetical protein
LSLDNNKNWQFSNFKFNPKNEKKNGIFLYCKFNGKIAKVNWKNHQTFETIKLKKEILGQSFGFFSKCLTNSYTP